MVDKKRSRVLDETVSDLLMKKKHDYKITFWIGVSLIPVYFWLLVPRLSVASDFPITPRSLILDGFPVPQTWSRFSTALGEYGVSTLWSWPVDVLYGFGALMGIDFVVLQRVIGIIPVLILGTFSLTLIVNTLKLGERGKFIAILFYLLNSYLLTILDGGQFAIALAYAMFPLPYLLFVQSVKKTLHHRILAALSVVALGYFDVRFIYLLLILLFLRFIFELVQVKREYWIKMAYSWILSGLWVIVLFFLLNAYWILPAILAAAPSLPTGYARVSQTAFLSFAKLGHAALLLQPHWYKNVFGQVTPLLSEFLIIPILVFLAPVLHRKKEVLFWTSIAIISVFLVKGANPPLPEVYRRLFTLIPGFSLFRDSTKFFFLTALSYSVLLGFTVDELEKRFNAYVNFGKFRIALIPVLITMYILFIVRPVWLGKMTGTFSRPYNKEQFLLVDTVIENDLSFGRVLWIPSRPPLGFSSPLHPSVEAIRLLALRPFEIGTVGSYETLNYLRESTYMGQIMDVAGIEYLSYPYPDIRRVTLQADNIAYYYAFLNQLNDLPWISKRLTDSPVPLLTTKQHQDRLFVANNAYYLVGSDRIYNTLINISDFHLADNALIFAEEAPKQLPQAFSNHDFKIIAYERQKKDVVLSFISEERFIFPAINLNFDPKLNAVEGADAWWKRETADFLWWRNFLQQKYNLDYQDFDYGGGFAIAEGDRDLTVYDEKLRLGDQLFVRVLKSSRGGTVEISNNNEVLKNIPTNYACEEKREVKLTGYKDTPDQLFTYDCADFAWVDAGSVTKEGELTIKTEGDLNVINAIVSVPVVELDAILRELTEDKIIYWEKLSDQERINLFATESYKPKITYERINPTRYTVTVAGIEKPTTLAFSETYDPLWELSGQPSIRLYSLINGFTVTQDGTYDLFFSPQKYVMPGLIVSGLTILTLLLALLIHKLRGNNLLK